ncbi:MAG: potassium-transporting ATPase subunit KdpC [Candidatus Acidiferrum sp.]
MKQHLRIAILMTIVTTMLYGLFYPLAVTGLAQLFFPAKANGSLILRNGVVVGSTLLGQSFSSHGYFHSRPSAAGTGYDASSSGGSNLGPTNHQLLDRVKADVEKASAENPGIPIPVDLVTTSGSGLDPDISPASAEFQIHRIARERHMAESDLRFLVARHTQSRQFGILGEPRVNVVELNLALDSTNPLR